MFVFLVLFQSFGLDVKAASEDNLVDSDLRNWEKWEAFDGGVQLTLASDKNHDIYYKMKVLPYNSTINGEPFSMVVGGAYDISNLISGNSYTFSLEILSPDLMSISQAYYDSIFSSGALMIGLCKDSISPDDVVFVDGYSIQIDSSNYKQYLGTDFKFTFEMPNVVNPSIGIFFLSSNANQTLSQGAIFGFRNIKLVDNESAKEDGFFSRLFEWFQTKFEAIGESFRTLGDRISDFFSDLGNKLNEGFTNLKNSLIELKDSFIEKLIDLKQSVIELKDNLIEGIKSLFIPNEDYLLQWKSNLDKLLQDHLGIIYTGANLVDDLLNLVFDIVFEAPDTYGISIPEVTLNLSGTEVKLFGNSIDFDFMQQKVFKTLYGMYTVSLYVFFGFLEVKYAISVYKRMMNN